jgi:hypothetical protein
MLDVALAAAIAVGLTVALIGASLRESSSKSLRSATTGPST